MNQRVLSGVRIISPDRTGISGSSMQLDRKLRDWPSLVERLADDLELGEFRILAISGGAPYAYATAVAIPERVRAIAIVGGVIQFAELKDFKGLLPFISLDAGILSGSAATVAAIVLAGPTVLIVPRADPASSAAFKDAAIAPVRRGQFAPTTQLFEAIFESQRRAWRGSLEGILVDARILRGAVGIRDRGCPRAVRLWHGIEDRAFAVRLAEAIANRFPNCKARFIQDEGHYSLPIRHMREILEDLIST